jgi:hypothetical protein
MTAAPVPSSIGLFAKFLLLCVAIVGAATLVATPASAHGETGVMTLLKAEADPNANGSFAIEVGLVYENDNEPAESATVEATLTAADGTQVGPVALSRTEGARYATTVQLAPGDYALSVVSTKPSATIESSVSVAPASTTSIAPTTTAVVATSSPEPPSTTATTIPSVGSITDSTSGWTRVGLALAGLAIVASAAVVTIRRRGQ